MPTAPSATRWPARLWRLLPAPARRRWLSRAGAFLAPRADRPAPLAAGGVVVAGELSRASGLGEGARRMLDALASLGIPAWGLDLGPLLPAHTPDLPPPPWPPPPPAGAALVLHVNPPLLGLALARLPRPLLRGRRRVGYFVWELPRAPADWATGIGLVHDVWTPSRFAATALAPLGPAPHVVPHPLAARPLAPAPLGRADFGLPEDALVVLVSANLASSFVRKNPLAAVAAFRAAFGNRPDRLLLLKLGHADHAPSDLAAIRAAVAGMENIRIETRSFPAAHSLALIRAADLVLSLHRSEGAGLVPAEAMLLGVPVIATGWSGNLDFMDADSAALVRYRLVPVADPRGVYAGPGAMWAEPDVADAAAWLRRLAEDAPARHALGLAGQEMAQARLGAAPLAAAVRALAQPPA
ncbi:MAG: glycosyltransferase [Acetobacteraceae bacterium]